MSILSNYYPELLDELNGADDCQPEDDREYAIWSAELGAAAS